MTKLKLEGISNSCFPSSFLLNPGSRMEKKKSGSGCKHCELGWDMNLIQDFIYGEKKTLRSREQDAVSGLRNMR
jgi:hypothetical protein